MICPKGYEEQTPKPERLVEENMTLEKRLAWHFQGRSGPFIELDDLMQAGYLGLLDASQCYSTREGVTFAAYAAIRVRSSIIDCLRRNSNLCQTTISMQQKVRAAERDLEMEHQRAKAPEELSENALAVTTTPCRARSQQPACDLLLPIFCKSTSHAFLPCLQRGPVSLRFPCSCTPRPNDPALSSHDRLGGLYQRFSYSAHLASGAAAYRFHQNG